MIRHKRLIRKRQHKAVTGGESVPYPLPENWKEVRKIGKKLKRWNTQTGKFDIDA